MAGMKFTIDFITNEKQLKKDLREAYKDAGATLSDDFAQSIVKAFEKVAGMKELKMFKGEFTGMFTSLLKGIAGAGENIDEIGLSINKFSNELKFLYGLSEYFKETHKVDNIFLGFEQKDMNKILGFYKDIEKREERINYLNDKNNRTKIDDEYLSRNKLGSVQEIKNLLGIPQKKFHDTYDKVMKSFEDKKIEGIDTDTIQERIKDFGETIDLIKELEKADFGKGSEKNIKAQQTLMQLHGKLSGLINGDDVVSKLLKSELGNIKLAELDTNKINILITDAINSEINKLKSQNQVFTGKARQEMINIANSKSYEIKKKADERQSLLDLAAENEGVSLEDLVDKMNDTSKQVADFTKVLESLSDALKDILKSSDMNKIKEKFEELFPKYEDLKKKGGLPTSDKDKQLIKDLVALSTRYTDLGGNIGDLLKKETDPASKAFKNILNGKSQTVEPIKADIEEIINAVHNMPKQIADSINGNNGNNDDSISTQNGGTGNTGETATNAPAMSDESANKIIAELTNIKSAIETQGNSIKDSLNTDIKQSIDGLVTKLNDGVKTEGIDLSEIVTAISDLGNKLNNITVNIPSDTSNNIVNSYKNVADIIFDMVSADATMVKNDIKLHERGMFFNSKTGQHTNEFIYGEEHAVPIELLKDAIKKITVDSMIHTHTGKYANMSFVSDGQKGDFFTFFKQLREDGIKKQITAAQNGVQIFDAEKFYAKYGKFFEQDITTEKLTELEKIIKDAEKALFTINNTFAYALENPQIKFNNELDSLKDGLIKYVKDNKNDEKSFYDLTKEFLLNNVNDKSEAERLFNIIEDFFENEKEGRIFTTQLAQEEVLKKIFEDNNFKMSDYIKEMTLDEFKNMYGGSDNSFKTLLEYLMFLLNYFV